MIWRDGVVIPQAAIREQPEQEERTSRESREGGGGIVRFRKRHTCYMI